MEKKNVTQSVTMLSLGVLAANWLNGRLGWNIGDADVQAIITIASLVTAAWGRWRAGGLTVGAPTKEPI